MDVTSLPIEYNKKEIDSRYRLCVIASQRARELALGAQQKIKTKDKNLITAALVETIEGVVPFLTGEDAVTAREKADKIDFKKLMDERRKSFEDLSELEKDLKHFIHERGTTERALDELFTESEEIEAESE